MRLQLHPTKQGYATEKLKASLGPGLDIDKPFVFLTGSNGTGKSSILRGIRATIGLTGERFGQSTPMHGLNLPDPIDKPGTFSAPRFGRWSETPAAVFDLDALGWAGQDCHLFDSRAISGLASKGEIGDDFLFHARMIAAGGARVSHGEFVGRAWFETIEWACSDQSEPQQLGKEQRDYVGKARSEERWLFIDEPEAAIDAEKLVFGISILLAAAEIGRLRIFCASHSILFAAGLIDHPKMQIVDLSSPADWVDTQKRALQIAADPLRAEAWGAKTLAQMRSDAKRRDPQSQAVGKRRGKRAVKKEM